MSVNGAAGGEYMPASTWNGGTTSNSIDNWVCAIKFAFGLLCFALFRFLYRSSWIPVIHLPMLIGIISMALVELYDKVLWNCWHFIAETVTFQNYANIMVAVIWHPCITRSAAAMASIIHDKLPHLQRNSSSGNCRKCKIALFSIEYI